MRTNRMALVAVAALAAVPVPNALATGGAATSAPARPATEKDFSIGNF
jgi:hypothetical protein